MIMRKFAIVLAAVAAFQSTPSLAAITIYTTEAEFLAAVGTVGVDTFNDILGPTPSPITRSAGAFGYTATASKNFFGAGSGVDRWLSTNTATDTITFNNFTGGVSAFGGLFFTSNLSGLYTPGSIVLTATDSSGTVSRTIFGTTTSTFLGFVSTGPLLSTTLTSVQPTSGDGFVWPTANNLMLAGRATMGAVPEPTTWAMMLVGFAGVGFSMRSAKRKTKVSFATA